ncbi:MAG: SecDF P1 head subdomain-containing protein [Pirellulales bacterium]
MMYLANSSPNKLVPILIDNLSSLVPDHLDPYSRYHAIEILGRIGKPANKAIPVLIKLLSSEYENQRYGALTALVKIDPHSILIMNAIAIYADDHNTVYQLGNYAAMAKPLGPIFVELLESEDPQTQIWAAWAMVRSKYDERRGLEFMLSKVKSGQEENRVIAATSLAALGSQAESMIPHLQSLENDADTRVAKEIKNAIRRIKLIDRMLTHAEKFDKANASRQAAVEAKRKLQKQLSKSKDQTSIHWGEKVDGLRLGIRSSVSTKNATSLSHGDSLSYEVWIKNENSEKIHILRDPTMTTSPSYVDGKIQLIGSMFEAGYSFPPEAFDKAILSLNPNESALLLPQQQTKSIVHPEDKNAQPFDSALIRIPLGKHAIMASKRLVYLIGGEPDRKRKDTKSSQLHSVKNQIEILANNPPPNEPQDIDWGEPNKQLRLGIRSSMFAKRSTPLRHGDYLGYEVWIKNESDEHIRISRDPGTLYSPRFKDKAVNITAWVAGVHLDIPPEEYHKALLSLAPNESALLLLSQYSRSSIRPVGTKRGRFGPESLLLDPGKYPIFSERDVYVYRGQQKRNGQSVKLKSATKELEILPAARFQFRKAIVSPSTLRLEDLIKNSVSKGAKWVTDLGETLIFNQSQGTLLDEDDLESIEVLATEKGAKTYSIKIVLNESAAKRFARDSKRISESKQPKPRIVILLDNQVITDYKMKEATTDGQLVVTGKFNKDQAVQFAREFKKKNKEVNTQETKANDGVFWSKTITNGFRSGAKFLNTNGILKSGEPLVIQYLLKNATDATRSISVVPGEMSYPVLGSQNRINLSLSPSNQKMKQWTLEAGQQMALEQHRITLDTTGFSPGDYFVSARSYFWEPHEDDPSSKSEVKTLHALPLTILSKQGLPALPPASVLSESVDAEAAKIHWGNSVAGLQLGALMLDDSQNLADGANPQIQLFARNIGREALKLDVMMPQPADGWTVSIVNSNGNHINPYGIRWSQISPQRSFPFGLQAGQVKALTGVAQRLDGGDPSQVKNATFQISNKPENGVWPGHLLEPKTGEYQLTSIVRFKRSGMPGLDLNTHSGMVPFRVVSRFKKEQTKPVNNVENLTPPADLSLDAGAYKESRAPDLIQYRQLNSPVHTRRG